MKFTKHSLSALFRLFTMTAVILIVAAPSFAYEEDTHFLMTYVICRSVGFTEQEALMVAAVDQGMDDSVDTNAHDGAVPQITEEWLWHALDKDGKMTASGVLARRDELFNAAVNEKDPRNRLIRLGIFFHFQQDTWAHRHHESSNHLSRTAYTTFNTPAGHGPWGPQPDRPTLDPVAAVMDVEDGIGYAADFIKSALGRDPNIFFNGYVPAGGKVDTAWKGKKKSKFFNQIDISGIPPDMPRLFLNSLIHTQIDAYPESRSPNPFYFGQQTSDQIDFDVARDALQRVCTLFRSFVGPIVIPSRKEKEAQGFTNMTTDWLLSLKPAGKLPTVTH